MDVPISAGTSCQPPGNIHHCSPDRLESRADLSVGHTFNSGARTNFLVYRGIQSSCGRARENLSNSGSIFDGTRTIDEPHRATRPAAVGTTEQKTFESAERR